MENQEEQPTAKERAEVERLLAEIRQINKHGKRQLWLEHIRVKWLSLKLIVQRHFLCNFARYRRRIGGTWYQVYDPKSDFGLAGDTYQWVQEVPEGAKVIKEEGPHTKHQR